MDNRNSVFTTSPIGPGTSFGEVQTARLLALPFCIKINLRGNFSDPAFTAAVADVTELTLPGTANTVVRNETGTLLWLGPDEWQWRSNSDTGGELAGKVLDRANELDTHGVATLIADFESQLAGIHSAVVDISDYYALFSLQGPKVFAVLEKGTPLNVREALSVSSQCAQTRFGNASVLLDRAAQGELAVQVQVRWSYAEYLWEYLSETMREFE